MTSKGFRPQSAALMAVGLLSLSGCSLLASRAKPPAPSPPPPVAVAPKPRLPAPVATHKFQIDPEHDDVVGQVQVTIASKADTLPDIARRFNVGYEEIVRANPGMDPWLPGEGKEVIVPTQFVLPNAPRDGIVINVAAMRVYYFPKGKAKAGEKQTVYTYPIGIGKVGWSTPEGSTKTVSKEKDPVWRPTASIRKEHKENGEDLPALVPAGPDNPLGAEEAPAEDLHAADPGRAEGPQRERELGRGGSNQPRAAWPAPVGVQGREHCRGTDCRRPPGGKPHS